MTVVPFPQLLILGASARSAAFSALRAGLVPSAVDRFGDVDLLTACLARRAIDYPADLPSIAREMPDCPWMYTGALENHPRLVDAISSTRLLYGNSGRVLRKVRNPLLVAGSLACEGLPHLDIRKSPPADGKQLWLRKPVNSCGGGRIRLASQQDDPAAGDCEDAFYYQRLADGEAASAIYVADGKRTVLLGVTHQLVGQAWAGGVAFQYCGSIGPMSLSTVADTHVRRIGHCLSANFGLKGLFGVDYIVTGDMVWPVEVNPRYTASVEVIERVSGIAAIALHVAACRGALLPSRLQNKVDQFAGKAIVYATQHGFVPSALADLAQQLNAGLQWPSLADIPGTGSQLQPGHPIATVLAADSSPDKVLSRLKELAQQVRRVVLGNG